MAITVEMRTEISQLYVALFGRAPDGEGLGFWVGLRDGGMSLTEIANAMYATSPARDYYPLFLTNEEIIASFYVNVLGRVADAEGLAFWTAKLNAAGATPGSVITEMIDVVANYAGADPDGLVSQALFNNKVEVAQFYGEANGNIADAATVLATVTADDATVTAAIAAITSGTIGQDGIDVTLTTSQDAIAGSPANDLVHGTFGSGAGVDTYTAGDSIDLGLGSVDQLNLAATGVTASSAIVVKNTEMINIQDTVGATFNALLVENAPAINFLNTLTAQTSMVTNGSLSSVYGLAGAGNMTVDFATTSGTADNAMVSLAGVGSSTAASTVNVSDSDTVEKVSIATTGTNFVTLVGGAAAASLTVTGNGTNTFTLSGAGALAAVATIDASASTGTNTFALGGNFNTGTVVKGGTGADTVSASIATATLNAPTFTGVETFSTTWTDYGVLDLGSTTGMTALSIKDSAAAPGTITVQNAQSTLATVTVSSVAAAAVDTVLKVSYASTSKGDLALKIGSTSATATAVDLGAVTITNSNSLNVTTLGALDHDIDGLTVKGNQTALGFTVAAGGGLTTGTISATGNLGALNLTLASESYFSGLVDQSAAKTIGDVTVNVTGNEAEADLRISGGTDVIGNVTFNITGNDNSGYFAATTSGGGFGNITVAINGDDNDMGLMVSAGYVSGTDGVGREQGNIGDITISVDGDDNTFSGGAETHDGDIGNITITAVGDDNDVNFSGRAQQAYYYWDGSVDQHSGYYHSQGGDVGNFSMTVDGDSSGDFGLSSSGGNIGDITVVATNDADIDFNVYTAGEEGWYYDAVAGAGGVGNIGNVSVTLGDDSTVSGNVYTSGGDIGNVSVTVNGSNASGHLYVYARADSGGYNLGVDSDTYLGGGNVGDVTISIDGSSYFYTHVQASGGSIGNVSVTLNSAGASGGLSLVSNPVGSGSPGGDIGTVNVTLGDDTGFWIGADFDGTMGAVTVAGGDDNWFDFYASGGDSTGSLLDDSALITSMSLTFGDNADTLVTVSGFSGSVGATTATYGDGADADWHFDGVKGSVGAMTLNFGEGGDTYIQLGSNGGNKIGSVGNISFTGGAGSVLYIESDADIGTVGTITIAGGDTAASAGVWLNNTTYNITTVAGVNASTWAGELGVDLSQVGHASPSTAVGTTIRAGTGGSDITGSEGADNIFLGTGQDTVHFDATQDADTNTDVIFTFTVGATKDVLDLVSAATVLEAVATVDTAVNGSTGDILRLADIAGGTDITTVAGLIAAVEGGEYTSVTMDASAQFTIVTAASATASTFYVFNVIDDGDQVFEAGEVTLVAQVNATAAGALGGLVLGNFM
jgi:hypothetical protein